MQTLMMSWKQPAFFHSKVSEWRVAHNNEVMERERRGVCACMCVHVCMLVITAADKVERWQVPYAQNSTPKNGLEVDDVTL